MLLADGVKSTEDQRQFWRGIKCAGRGDGTQAIGQDGIVIQAQACNGVNREDHQRGRCPAAGDPVVHVVETRAQGDCQIHAPILAHVSTLFGDDADGVDAVIAPGAAIGRVVG